LPKDVFARRAAPAPLTRQDWRAIGALLLLFVPVSFFWATYEQQGNTIVLWASQYTDRHLWGGVEIPVTWFQAFNPFMIFAFTPFIVALWRRQGAREPSTVMKMAIGLFLNAASWLIMLAAARLAGTGQASWLWLFAFTFAITVGELYLSPTSLSLVTKVAPARMVSMMMGVWFLSSFFGNYLSGFLGTFWEKMPRDHFFLMLASIPVAAGILMMLINRPLQRVVGKHDRQEG
jgi:POT family proton-dependent oligopeptide transporter